METMNEVKVTEKTKVCSKCGRELPLSEFYTNNRTPDGLQYYCNECMRKAQNNRSVINNTDDDSDSELSKYTPRQLMEELKRRGFTWDYMVEPQRKIYYNKI